MKHLLPSRWILTIAFLAILAISGCGKKNDETASTTPSSAPAGENTPQSTSTTPSAPVTATSPSSGKATTATSPTKGTLTAEAQQLGVKPQGTACPKNAPVKGKITAKRGNIYHTAKSPDFAKVNPDICFADTATAEKAGFSAPKAK
ncbi:MAG: hypothetical protein DSM106950_18785 [Stigonema ocellatum SAG 48.90 = DSM 106950]|nr:hypothetical protein [Stigonema ocellatum SAG 48.90 = DSM 106950]